MSIDQAAALSERLAEHGQQFIGLAAVKADHEADKQIVNLVKTAVMEARQEGLPPRERPGRVDILT